MNQEMRILEALNATGDENIEEHRIPRIYYHGRFRRHHYAIAMTLFDGTVDERFKQQKRSEKTISDISILLIFREAVCATFDFNKNKIPLIPMDYFR